MENSFHSRGSKNFVLKSDYLNNNSRHGSKKNLSSFVDPGLYNQNQKSLFKTGGSFLDQEDEDFKKDNMNTNIFNKNIFYENNENNFWNKNKNSHNHSNLVQDYFCQNMDENMDLFNNQFNNMNLSNNEINDNNDKNNNINNNHYFNINYFNNANSGPNSVHSSNNSPNINYAHFQNNNSNSNNNNNINLAEINSNSITNETSTNNTNANSNNNLNNNNFININPVLINQNNFNRQLILNSYNNNNTNNTNFHFPQNIQPNQMYNPQSQNLNNLKNGEIPLALLKKRDENLINNCVTLCKEQIECRLLQKKIDEDPSLASNVIYDKIKDKVQEISCDQFSFIKKYRRISALFALINMEQE